MKQCFITALAVLLLAGCTKTELQQASGDPTPIVTTSQVQLSSRLKAGNVGVVQLNTSITGISGNGSSNPYPMELLTSVQAPVYRSSTLRATHVAIDGNYAFVSYNTEGETYLGGIDIFNISNTTQPKLIANIIIPDTDISALVYANNRVYFAGATDISKLAGTSSPAMIGWLQLSNGVPTGKFKYVHLAGQVATDIAISGTQVLAVTGANGGFYATDLDSLRVQQTLPVSDLRSVAISNGRMALLSGTSGLNVYGTPGFAPLGSIALGNDIAESKRTIDFNNNYVLVAGGRKGILYYNSDNGTKAGALTLPAALEGIDIGDVVTNAVSNNNGLFFAANGAAGTYVCKPNADNTLLLLGAINLDGSANYVKSKDNYIFVASGRSGLNILKFTPPTTTTSCTGLPAYTGSANLNVNSNQNLSYGGSVALQNVNVNASLYYCGAMTVSDNLQVNSNGKFELRGSLAVGSNPSRSLIINSNATLKVEGSLTVYGDLRLNDGARLEFGGSNSSITVNGRVYMNKNKVTISGNFTDVSGKLK